MALRLPSALSALQHANFRLYFFGQAVSILGSWMQQVALSWLVYRLTGSSALLGVTAFCSLAPQLVVSPLAGALIDRHDKRRLLILVEALLGVQALALALLTWSGHINPGMLIGMALLLGILSAVEIPARQSLILHLVGDRRDLNSAVSLNAAVYSIGRFVGPPVAGVLLGLYSEAFCFALNAVSFGALILGLNWMKFAPTAPADRHNSIGAAFREGLGYAWNNYLIRTLLILQITFNLSASTWAVLLPAMAKDVLGGDAQTLGWLWGASGGGALAGTFVLGMCRKPSQTAGVLVASVVTAALAMLAFSQSTRLLFALPAMAALGAAVIVTNVGCNAILQNVAPEQMRGRMLSFFTATRFGFDALGGLVVGFLAAHSSPAAALFAEGLLLAATSAWLLSHSQTLRSELTKADE